MENIKRSDLQNISPVYDLTRSEELEQLDRMAPQTLAAPQLEGFEIDALERMLGLYEVAPQAATLKEPPMGDLSLSMMSGPQIRGFFRKMVMNFRFTASQLMEQDALKSESTESNAVSSRLGHVSTMVDLLDEILNYQDGILARMSTEQKA